MASQRRWRKRRRSLLLGLLLLVFLGIAGTYMTVIYRARSELEVAVAEAERDNGPWRLDEIEAKREAVPEVENSFFILTKTNQLLPWPWPIWENSANGKDLNISDEQLGEMKTALSRSSEQNPNMQLSQLQTETLRKEIQRIDP